MLDPLPGWSVDSTYSSMSDAGLATQAPTQTNATNESANSDATMFVCAGGGGFFFARN